MRCQVTVLSDDGYAFDDLGDVVHAGLNEGFQPGKITLLVRFDAILSFESCQMEPNEITDMVTNGCERRREAVLSVGSNVQIDSLIVGQVC